MFGVGFRTPAKVSKPTDPDTQKPVSPKGNASVEAGPSESLVETESLTKVRRSIGEWETGKAGSNLTPPSSRRRQAHVSSPHQKVSNVTVHCGNVTTRKTSVATAAISLGMEMVKPRGRVAEAKACLIRAKLQINSSRNLKAEIKTEVIQAVETLYRLVKEAEAAKPLTLSTASVSNTAKPASKGMQETLEGHGLLIQRGFNLTEEVMREVKRQGEQIAAAALGVGAVKDQITQIKESVDRGKVLEGTSYAAVAAIKKQTAPPSTRPQAVHSMIVSSADAHDTSEDVLNKIRTAVSARTSGIRVDRLRKARDQKVVLGCESREEMAKVIERLKTDSPALNIKQVENKDPLVILFGVLTFNTDDEVLEALRRQNGHILGSIPEEDYRASVKFRRKARNPLENHVVLQVSPRVWQCLTSEGKIHVDLQRVVVKDQSPLMTCSRCLGYGHSRKTCQESVDTCSHCAGPHLRSECPAWKAGENPTCCNCQSARLDRTDHNSFDGVCPVRKKWDALARARVAYC